MLAGIYPESVRRAQQDNFISDGDTSNPGHIHKRQIHRDSADNGRVVFAHNDFSSRGKLAIQTIRIADRQHGNTCRSLRNVGAPISQRLIGTGIA